MVFGSKLNVLTCTAALSLGVGASILAAPVVQAQVPGERPTLIDCDPATAPNNVCSNGLGASFFFPFAEAVFPAVFPGQYNYGSRGSSQGIEGLVFGACNDDNQVPGGTLVPDPCSFFFSEAPLNDADFDDYYEVDPTDADGDGLRFGAGRQGLGAPVQVPVVGGLVTISVDAGGGVTTLTAQEVCEAFNDTPSAGNPLAGKNGVHRSDGSGTSFIFTNALQTQCAPLGLWEYTNANGTFDRGAGEDPFKESDPECSDNNPNTPVNGTCWPDRFLSGDGNDGVADEVISGAGGNGNRFGYVELAEALSRGNSLQLPSVANLNGGAPVAPTTENGTAALNAPNSVNDIGSTAAPGDPANTCQLTANRFNPSVGWPYVGVSYGFFFGDYSPSAADGGNEAQFSLRGSNLRNRYLALFTNPQVQSIAASIGYVPIQDVNVPNDLGDISLQTFLLCTRP
ncbi:MAG: substrate-binding domain-containing protein [Leptolyngbyaceae cyanobacterium]